MYVRVGPPRFRESCLIRESRIALSRMGLARWLIGFAWAFSMLMSGCSRTSDLSADTSAAVTIQHEISPQPARVGAATVVLKLADSAGKPVAGAHIAIEADMTHAGMS